MPNIEVMQRETFSSVQFLVTHFIVIKASSTICKMASTVVASNIVPSLLSYMKTQTLLIVRKSGKGFYVVITSSV